MDLVSLGVLTHVLSLWRTVVPDSRFLLVVRTQLQLSQL